MNWLTDFVKPKLRALVTNKSDIPDDLWYKCKQCDQMIFHKNLKKNLYVCHHCDYHMRIDPQKRFNFLFDDGKYNKIETPKTTVDPLRFKDLKKYSERLKEAKKKTGQEDAAVIAEGNLGGNNVVAVAFNFDFIGGSMGTGVGEAFLTATNYAISRSVPFIVIPSSGGARMQESILSLMQMPRTVIGVTKLRNANLPYITVLTDPTTGGVSASFAMLGDIAIAEPGAIIGFAGARVIKETIKEELPKGFQRAEFLLEHGMVDAVVHRKNLRNKLIKILKLLTKN